MLESYRRDRTNCSSTPRTEGISAPPPTTPSSSFVPSFPPSSRTDEPPQVRLKDSQDGAEPSASGVALSNLYRLGAYFDDTPYAPKTAGVLRASGDLLGRAPFAVGTTVGGMWLGRGFKQVRPFGLWRESRS